MLHNEWWFNFKKKMWTYIIWYNNDICNIYIYIHMYVCATTCNSKTIVYYTKVFAKIKQNNMTYIIQNDTIQFYVLNWYIMMESHIIWFVEIENHVIYIYI